MKISLVVREFNKDGRKFFSASCQGKFLDKANVKRFDAEADKAIYFIIKFTKGSPIAIPAVEGIYDVELADDAELWKDNRPESVRPTIWVKTGKQATWTKKQDLTKKA